MSRKVRASVFYATYGHWSQALLNAGFEVIYHFQPDVHKNPDSETGMIEDPLASRILRRNFPDIEVRKPDVEDEACDLIVGSPPCVGFSRANPKANVDHPCNKHVFNFFKWVCLNGPRYFLMEMVPSILKSENKKILDEALARVRSDYYYDGEVLEASEYGAVQKRSRYYVFGVRSDQETCFERPWDCMDKASPLSIGLILPKELVEKFDNYKPDGRLLLSPFRKDGRMIAGAWGSLTPKKRKNRTLHRDGLMFTITGTSIRDCLHYSKERLLSIPELKLLMGFPSTYELPYNLNVGVASKVIASGVDIRFATYLLKIIRLRDEV